MDAPAPAHVAGRQLRPAGVADRPGPARGPLPAARAGQGAVARRARPTSPRPRTTPPSWPSAPRSARASTSSPTARSAARATPTTSPPRSTASTSTTPAPRSTARGHPNPVPRIVGPITRRAPGRGRRPGVPQGAHRPSGQDDGARAVHDDPAGAERPLPGPRVGRDGVRRRRQRRDQGPARRGRRRRADRRAVPAGPPRRRPRLRPRRAHRGARRRHRHHRRAPLLRLRRDHPRAARRATRSCRSWPGCPVDQISIETAQSGLDLGVLADLADKTIILGVLDLSTPEVETAETVADRVRRAYPYLPARQLVIAPDCGMKYLPRRVRSGQDAGDGRSRRRAACRGGVDDAARHRGQHHRPGRGALGHGEGPAARGDPDVARAAPARLRPRGAAHRGRVDGRHPVAQPHRADQRREARRSSSSPPTCWGCRCSSSR